MKRSLNNEPYDSSLPPEEKARQFDVQFWENVDAAERKRQEGIFPYDLDRKAKRPPWK